MAARRRTQKKQEPKRRVSVFVVIAGIFLLAVFTRICFPVFSERIGDKIDAVTNYRAAFSVVGEGLSGEKRFSDAMAEAWALAFNPGAEPVSTADDDEAAAAAAFSVQDANDPISEESYDFINAVNILNALSPNP